MVLRRISVRTFLRLLGSTRHSSSISSEVNATSSASTTSVVRTVCSLVCESYYQQHQSYITKTSARPVKLNLHEEDHKALSLLSPEQAAAVVAALAEEAGSLVALSFFCWAVDYSSRFREAMRLYILSATALVGKGNMERANEVMECLVRNFAVMGKLREAVCMVLDMRTQGLYPGTKLLNCVLGVACEFGLVEVAEDVFDEMCESGGVDKVSPDATSLKMMVIAYCRMGRVKEMERWLSAMLDRGLLVDNATLTMIIRVLTENGCFGRALFYFHKFVEMGLSANLINYTALIDGLCRGGSIKQAFQMFEEMVGKGWKPNVYTHTTLIDGMCKKGWTDKAFRLFLKLVRSENYKPDVYTYTAMVSGYCKEGKLNRAEALLTRMKEQGLVPNTNTYTTIIDGHCKSSNFARAYELMEVMRKEGFPPNIYTYNAVIDGLFKRGRSLEAHKLLGRAFQHHLQADQVTYTILLNEHCKRGEIKQALAFFNKILKLGCSPDIHSYTSLITIFSRQKDMKECERLFDVAISLGLVPTKQTYTSMISGYSRYGKSSLAVKYFEKMRDHGCVPDSISYGALISGLCRESKLNSARRLYDSMMDKGLAPSEVTRLTLAYEYCKKDESAVAMAILERLDKKLWIRTVNSLIRKLCCEKKVGIASLFLHRLLDKDPNLDRVTHAAFMTTCYESNNYALPKSTIEGWIILITIHRGALRSPRRGLGEFGDVKNLHLNLDRRIEFVKGYALIEYKNFVEAQAAISAMDGAGGRRRKEGTLNGAKIKGRMLVCTHGISVRVNKGHETLLAGAVGLILANVDLASGENADTGRMGKITRMTKIEDLQVSHERPLTTVYIKDPLNTSILNKPMLSKLGVIRKLDEVDESGLTTNEAYGGFEKLHK
ncbi:unnamed protein product [Rhodiola kirilowii]